MNDTPEIFIEEDDADNDIIEKYQMANKILLADITLWDRFKLWWHYGLKFKQLGE